MTNSIGNVASSPHWYHNTMIEDPLGTFVSSSKRNYYLTDKREVEHYLDQLNALLNTIVNSNTINETSFINCIETYCHWLNHFDVIFSKKEEIENINKLIIKITENNFIGLKIKIVSQLNEINDFYGLNYEN